ncbi:MAG: inorganic pyrophosphatase [Opitutales bacterium]
MGGEATHFYERYRPHPWHGIEPGPEAPGAVNVYVEITPFDLIKYELDPHYGFLRVDRPQRNSSLPPAVYGIVPQTLCGDRVARFCPEAEAGDEDPLDICVLSEHEINRSEVLLTARVVGGIRTRDNGKSDEKIIGILDGDLAWGGVKDMANLPSYMVNRLWHYFSTYKQEPGKKSKVDVLGTYGAGEATAIVQASIEDYRERFAT